MGRSLAILGVPGVLGGKRVLVVTAFSQSYGDEWMDKGNCEGGDPPPGWSTSGNVAISVGEERTGGAGTQSLKITTTAIGGGYAKLPPQAEPPEGKFYQATYWGKDIDVGLNGVLLWRKGTTNIVSYGWGMLSTSWKQWRALAYIKPGLTGNLAAYASVHKDAAADKSFLGDDFSFKEITINPQWRMPSANGEIVLLFSFPASLGYDGINVYYRTSGESLLPSPTGWIAQVRRRVLNDAWEFYLSSVSAGVSTGRISVSYFVGAMAGLKIRCQGSKHNCYTTANGVDWTQRGTEIDVSHNDSEKGISVVYTSGAVPTSLTVTAG